jgi:hypothetical protein
MWGSNVLADEPRGEAVYCTVFFSLIVFGGTEVSIFFLISSAAPQRTAYREVPSQMASHLRTGNPL